MFSLVAHCLDVTLEAVTPVELNEHQGAALRGALYGALRGPFCAQKHLTSCADCMLVGSCPLMTLVSTLNPRAERGRDVPRPYVIEPLLDGRTHLEPGEVLTFRLTLFARALQLFPYVILALRTLEHTGLGKPVAANGWRRGKVRVLRVAATNPLIGACQPVFETGEALVRVPDVPITHAQVLETAARLARDRLGIAFLTPTRLVERGQLLKRPEPGPLFHRLWQRLADLEREFGDAGPSAGQPANLGGGPEARRADRTQEGFALVALARRARLVDDRTNWVEVESYSSRQRRPTPMSGLVGCAVYEGDMGPLLPWFVWGQFAHVGKDAVKGNGWYRIDGA